MTVDRDRAARQDITDVIVRYATGIDRRDWDLFRTCFTEDVRAEYEGIDAWTGADALTSFMESAHAGMGHTMQRLTNLVIDVEGDRATARSYVDNVNLTPDGQRGTHTIGLYDDELVRTDDGWRIARRRFTPVRFGTLGAP